MESLELKNLVGFGLSCGELMAGLSDGIGFDDFKELINVAKQAKPALAGAQKALTAYINMTDQDALELEKYVVDEFDIADDKVEDAIEQGLKVVIEVHSLIGLLAPKPTVPVSQPPTDKKAA